MLVVQEHRTNVKIGHFLKMLGNIAWFKMTILDSAVCDLCK